MSDPYFQSLFAERIGGVNYGKGTEIYKFEKIKRAKRAATAAHPQPGATALGVAGCARQRRARARGHRGPAAQNSC